MYQALYRKYRPMDFDSVVGQDSIIKTLKNSIIHQNFSHAYMFFGPRGTGKTTVSKIFARNVNCLNPKDGIACGKCEHCKSSFSKDCIDIIEIDAASNNGVDEIRDLKNKISLVPSELKYKVYIIDEVHMLSIGAFNALLKTLEEPPEHAIFILATTDSQKVPETIVSRCQCFSFKRISPEIISERLESVCKSEKIKIDPEVLENIAVLSDGGLRDALGMLDKLTSYTDKKITMDDFTEVNGIISQKQLMSFLESLLKGDISSVLSDINLFDNSGKNLVQILIQILYFSRNLLVDYYLNQKEMSFSVDLLQEFTNLLNEKMIDIKKSSNTRIYIEMLLLKFMNQNQLLNQSSEVLEKEEIVEKSTKKQPVEKNISTEKVVEETIQEEKEDEDFDFSKEYGDDSEDYSEQQYFVIDSNDDLEDDSDSEGPRVLNIEEINKVRINNTLALADKKLLKEESLNFEKLKDFTFDQEIGYLVCSILDSKLRAVSDENMIISFDYDSNVKQNLAILDKMMEVYEKITKSSKKIAIVTNDEWENLKNEYIENLKNGIKYEVQKEPDPVLEELQKNDIISNSAVELFGDIVEVE